MARKPWRRRIASLRAKVTPVDPTEELYGQAFTGPKRPEDGEQQPPPDNKDSSHPAREERPIGWFEIGAYAAGSSALVCAVGVVGVLAGR